MTLNANVPTHTVCLCGPLFEYKKNRHGRYSFKPVQSSVPYLSFSDKTKHTPKSWISALCMYKLFLI